MSPISQFVWHLQPNRMTNLLGGDGDGELRLVEHPATPAAESLRGVGRFGRADGILLI